VINVVKTGLIMFQKIKSYIFVLIVVLTLTLFIGNLPSYAQDFKFGVGGSQQNPPQSNAVPQGSAPQSNAVPQGSAPQSNAVPQGSAPQSNAVPQGTAPQSNAVPQGAAPQNSPENIWSFAL
jgi:hypothetical protein